MSQFDKKFDRSITGTRKWNPDLLKEKNPIGNNIIAMDLADIDFEKRMGTSNFWNDISFA